MPEVISKRSPTDLPTPRLVVTPAKAGYPREGGKLDLLVSVGVDLPSEAVDRKPIALALVLDRSGSMSGQPLEAAKAATCAAIEMLMPDDWVSVVTFDSVVEVVAPLASAGRDRSALLAAVRSIDARGSTALFGGWAEGMSQVMSCPLAEAAARVIVLSDGGANVGVSDAPSIAADVGQATTYGVTTTSLGFGRHYDENLMRSMADAGQGNYVFIEGEAQVAEAFQQELSGLSALRGRNVRLEPSAGMSLASAVPGQLPAAGAGVGLPDLIGGLERDLVLTATFTSGAAAPALSLAWTDLLSGTDERLVVAVDIPALDREQFDALAADPSVAQQVSLARIANLKLELSQALRTGHSVAKTRLFKELEAAIWTLPVGVERTNEESELARLREFEKANDVAMASRFAERKARDRAYGTSDFKRSVQSDMERDLYAKKMRALEATSPSLLQPSHPNLETGTLARVNLNGPHGTVNVRVLSGDITTQRVDVLVNSTNRRLFGNAGVDGAVHRRGGPELTQAARQIGGVDYGQAVFTPGFRLPARYVVHAVAMPWQGGGAGEANVLESAYRSAFAVAAQLGARTLAVAALGTGAYGVPLDVAARIALSTLEEAVQAGAPFSDVRFVILDAAVAHAFAGALPGHGAGNPSGVTN